MKVDGAIKQVAIVDKSRIKNTQDLVTRCATGFLVCADRTRRNNPDWFYWWSGGGHMKIVLKADLQKPIIIQNNKVEHYDDLNGITVLGPAPSEIIDQMTKGLKLY